MVLDHSLGISFDNVIGGLTMTTASTKNLMTREEGMTMAELVIALAITGALSVFLGTELQAVADRGYRNTAGGGGGGGPRDARRLAVRGGQNNQGGPGP